MKTTNYYLKKNSYTGEVLYLEYDKIKGYKITPKTKIEDAIVVNKIIFINPGLREKLIRKKIDIKIRSLINDLKRFEEDDSDDEDGIRNSLMDAEKLRVNLLTNYVKYLGNTYQSLSMRKIQIIVNQLRMKLFECANNKRMSQLFNNNHNNDLYYLDENEYKGRGR